MKVKNMKRFLVNVKREVEWVFYYIKFLISYYTLRDSCEKMLILVGMPKHSNIGDAAIALAERKLIKEQLANIKVVEIYGRVIDRHTKVFERVIARKDIIAITGGGSLGTLWMEEEIMFRKVVTAFLNNPIIFFPQSVYYEDTQEGEKELEITEKIYSSHPNLTVCLREEYSYQFFEKYFSKVCIKLIPDMVLYMKCSNMLHSKREGIGLCFRTDCEQIIGKQKQEIEMAVKEENINYLTTMHTKRIPKRRREKVVRKKWEEFAQNKLIITDRLHGMIFAIITDTPCIAFDNISHKVKGVYQWVRDSEQVYFCEDSNNLKEIVERLKRNKENFSNNIKLDKYYKELGEIIKKL